MRRERLTSATLPNSAMISPLLSISSFCTSRRNCRRVSVVLSTPRSSNSKRASRKSESAYEVERTLETLDESGLVARREDGVGGTGEPSLKEDATGCNGGNGSSAIVTKNLVVYWQLWRSRRAHDRGNKVTENTRRDSKDTVP